ncbi:Separase [Purpureocillium takamizusanense]|uniref:separase n=1 Tax=Purpureocillium takamizusanense TaxID=2060973 RepID=A0A9Q8QN11_9HYPO|nr:Separase [Purpureocillium takamizusanense]UNI21442.1 Separase [Purpureocillium takamizusanense]
MASLQAKVEAVKTAVTSAPTCTPATVVTLKELLLPDAEPTAPKTKSAAAARTTTTKTKSAGAVKAQQSAETLGARERTVLATHVINATLKVLAEAAKPPPPSTPSKRAEQLKQIGRRRSLRRSASAPLTPLQPRTLNRVATSPIATSKDAKSVAAAQAAGCLATVECARVAFACLRSLKGTAQDGKSDFQLENGMSALVSKLLALGMHDQALKELRILKRRLDGTAPAGNTKSKVASESSSPAAVMADLLQFHNDIPKQSLPTTTSFQILVLKLVAATKKPAHIEALAPALRLSNSSSPINLLSDLAQGANKGSPKAARQLAVLSQILLSIAPSVSSAEDAVAVEPRLSPSPPLAFELQTLAFQAQLKWWTLAGHEGNVDEEVLPAFTRCIRAFVRRQRCGEGAPYPTIAKAFDCILRATREQNQEPSTSSSSPLASIYQILGATAHSARAYDDADKWLQRLKACLCPQTDSVVRRCSVSARILAASLKKATLGPDIQGLLQEVIEGLDGSLSGTVTELNELLESLSAARRSVAGLLMNVLGPDSALGVVPDELIDPLKTFTLRYPRFVRRWLGTPPAKDATAKQVLQFDQRRQTVTDSVSQVLDAAMMIIKSDMPSGALEWHSMDDVLQHCSSLLDTISDATLSIGKLEKLGMYYVKISSLYFSKFIELRNLAQRSKEANKQMLQSLSRSIDAVKERSTAEKEKAQLSTKLELFADLCKGAGRADDAVQTLRSICTGMAEDGVLSDVTAALASKPPALAWQTTEKASSLSRTLRSIAKLDRSWTDWTFFLPEAERAAVLEHLMHLNCSDTTCSQPLRLHDPSPAALLRIYTLDRYPIRRFRVLLHLFYQNIGEQDEVDDISSLLDQVSQHVQKKDPAEDASLSHYIPHLQTCYTFMAALADADRPTSLPTLKESIAAWKTMVQPCQTSGDLYTVIDDPATLLHQLHALNDLAGLRGEQHLQLAISDFSIILSRAIVDTTGVVHDDLVLSHSQLATRHVNIGNFTQAQTALEQTKALIEQNEKISAGVVADFYLSQAECQIGVGNLDEAMQCISKANDICSDSRSTWAQSKSHATVMLAMVSLLQSVVSLQKGDIPSSLTAIKSSVRMLSHDWAKLESALASTNSSPDSSMSETSMTSIDIKGSPARTAGPRFWGLASPLLRSLLHISSVYAHIGMLQETIYYAESALKIAEGTQSSLYRAQVSCWTGSVYVKAGRLDRALPLFEGAEELMPRDACASRVRFARQLAEFYRKTDNHDKANHYLKMAEDTVHLLSGSNDMAKQVSERVAPKAKATTVTSGRVARTTRAQPTAAPRTTRKVPAARSRVTVVPESPSLPKDVYQSSLLAAIILSRAIGFVYQKDWSSASSLLEQVKTLPKLISALSQEQVITATTLIGQSMEQMISDPVFSVVQDSTISFPAVCGGSDKGALDKSPAGASPTRRGRPTAVERRGSRERGGPAFADALRQAQGLLMEAHGSALCRSDSSMVHRISALLQNTIILLSATSTSKGRSTAPSGLATVAVDLARNITWTREQATLKVSAGSTAPGTMAKKNRRSSLSMSMDAAAFQQKYIEKIPKAWSVISLSLSENRHDLCITKFQAGSSPFILRLPLERANSRDADSEVFNFEHGQEELLDIIKLANETSHSARDFSAKGERSAWWSEREALDARLKELLMTIETTWLGGFKGIFSQHRRRPELLARFQKSFHKMLDRSLPSRNRTRGRKSAKSQTVTLDPRILELFIGLGDPTEPDLDYDEALNDLLYFVVDILQFHGERNAYDEIDFDAMVVETYDALRGYYDGAKAADRADGTHTILVLDKALHAFPWESLPCMQGSATSRVPSLACLGQLMAQANMTAVGDSGETLGHSVSSAAGTYMLNPSSDLKNTQAFFQPAFKTLASWDGVVGRTPEEAEFERALSSSEVLLYFGHGSGAQYIRGKTVRRLERCRPVTFLMGCSSAALTDAGEFECYGPVWNYMMAGCPAVVGTLWDVTDRDIDRFAGRAFEEWGLFARGTFSDEDGRKKQVAGRAKEGGSGSGGSVRGKGKSTVSSDDAGEVVDARVAASSSSSSSSLAEAVARAREACKFRYLNAAAVVMYGIPAYLGPNEDP